MSKPPNLLVHCPRCGEDTLDSVDGKLYGCSHCGYTYFHNTAVSVAAVIRRGDTVAWITRAREPGAGLLDLPGGFVEGDESLESAVLREVREETGFEAANPRYLFSIPNRYTYHGVNYTTVDVFFLCDLTAEAEFAPNSEASALAWMVLEAIDPRRIAFDSTRSALVRLLGS